jgi:hypothetical protein
VKVTGAGGLPVLGAGIFGKSTADLLTPVDAEIEYALEEFK